MRHSPTITFAPRLSHKPCSLGTHHGMEGFDLAVYGAAIRSLEEQGELEQTEPWDSQTGIEWLVRHN